jgi:hypothetical protein
MGVFSSPHFGQPSRRRGNATSYRSAVGHTGLRVLEETDYRSWKIIVEHVVLGMTLRREQYRLRLVDTHDSREEYLTGFANKVTALEAARRRIDFILDIQRPRTRTRHPQRSNLMRTRRHEGTKATK